MQMKNETYNTVLQLLQASLWNKEPPSDITLAVYEEMRSHTVELMIAPIFSSLSLPPDLRDKWEKNLYYHAYRHAVYKYEETKLGITVPYVILKGTASAQYYPDPNFRAMGDIDIMTSRDDLEEACSQLENAGYRKKKQSNREIVFTKRGIVVELHRRYASLNDASQAKYLDQLIIDNINPSHFLPDLINGLTLLEHISQHLEHGLGLRQIIDWMMFVDRCLPDEKWPEFSELAKNISLEKLAIVATRMSEMYLGLTQRMWSSAADEALCEQLMEYIMGNGNFGNKKMSDSDITENVFAHATTPRTALKLLQTRGLVNWKDAQKHKILRPFAWIYQTFRYITKGINRERAGSRISADYRAAKKRIIMLDSLGVKRSSKGIAQFEDGKYVKK